ncbi:hypothetical protein ACH5AO_34880 [Streptomyces sp. NPDC018964]|uniref:hypothetical protein n=1 Tax=unclassified Streptomyces TaxID=2593676 RepID=UPI00378894CC
MASPDLRPAVPARPGPPALRRHLRPLAAGFRIGIATAYRYLRGTVDLLTALAPALDQAMTAARKKAYVILGGTVPPTSRTAPGRRNTTG